MKLRVVEHDVDVSGGKAIRASEGDVDAFLCWGHIPTIHAIVGSVPEQFARATYFCDLEVHDDGLLVVHKERAFRTREQAHSWFQFVAQCLAQTEAHEYAICHEHPWEPS